MFIHLEIIRKCVYSFSVFPYEFYFLLRLLQNMNINVYLLQRFECGKYNKNDLKS